MDTSWERAERRSLRVIERRLSADAPHLAGMFQTFTRLNRGEELPRTDPLRERRAHRAWLRAKAFAAACLLPGEPIDAAEPWPGQPRGR
jgi:hypothetical protein